MEHIKLTAQSKTKHVGDQQNLQVDGIVSFTERPRMEPTEGLPRMGAHDLFSLFTANIIKAKTLFTR